jgi:hypothetical protein
MVPVANRYRGSGELRLLPLGLFVVDGIPSRTIGRGVLGQPASPTEVRQQSLSPKGEELTKRPVCSYLGIEPPIPEPIPIVFDELEVWGIHPNFHVRQGHFNVIVSSTHPAKKAKLLMLPTFIRRKQHYDCDASNQLPVADNVLSVNGVKRQRQMRRQVLVI